MNEKGAYCRQNNRDENLIGGAIHTNIFLLLMCFPFFSSNEAEAAT